MNMPRFSTPPPFYLRLRENKECQICYKALQYIRHINPVYWISILAAALVLFIAAAPANLWTYLLHAATAHTLQLGMLLLFGVLSVSLVWTAGQKIDAAVFHFFNRPGWKYPWLDNIMRLLTELGNSVVTVLVAVYLFFGVNRSVAYSFILGSLILWLIVESIKAVLRRARPFARLENVRVVGTKARGKSFPSGHTCQAFFTAAVLLNFIDGGFISYAIIYALAVLVGVTRMYMGMHYPRDVLGGAVLGSFWGLIAFTVNSHIVELIGRYGWM